jgi:hypothetical protein
MPPAGASAGTQDDAKKRMIAQVGQLDGSYHGGLKAYIQNAKKLLSDSKEGGCPPPASAPQDPARQARLVRPHRHAPRRPATRPQKAARSQRCNRPMTPPLHPGTREEGSCEPCSGPRQAVFTRTLTRAGLSPPLRASRPRPHRTGRNPFDGYTPEVPHGEKLDYASDAFMSLEERVRCWHGRRGWQQRRRGQRRRTRW